MMGDTQSTKVWNKICALLSPKKKPMIVEPTIPVKKPTPKKVAKDTKKVIAKVTKTVAKKVATKKVAIKKAAPKKK